MGVGHIDAVSGLSGCDWEQASVDEYRSTCRERDIRVLCGHFFTERDEADEPSEHGVGERDGAWVEHGADDVHWEPSGGADGVRADDVGVGHVGAVPAWSGCDGESVGGINSGRACGKLYCWLLC